MPNERYVGLDVHKRHVVVAAVDAQQRVVMTPRKVSVEHFAAWAQANLGSTDQIALETTSNAWTFHDMLAPLVGKVSVANSYQMKVISASARKTDKRDALVLAKLLAAAILPSVWVPPQAVRDLRALTAHRTQLLSERTAAKNRLHSILHRHNLPLPKGKPFKQGNRTWWDKLPVSLIDQLQIQHLWLTIQQLNELIEQTEAQIAQQSILPVWQDAMTLLLQLPGLGLYTGMTVLAAIGDITRFPSASQLVGYAGLGARVHASGDTYRTGKISKQGRSELRTALIASAWVAVRYSSYWRCVFQTLTKRLNKNKAIVAVARKLLVTIWHILTKRETDRHVDPMAVARSLMTWCSLHHLARSQAKRRLDFVRQRLAQLGLLDKVPSFRANGRVYAFAT